MKVATIVPTSYLYLTATDDYFLCLTHIAKKDPGYRDFFRVVSRRGGYIIVDNGAAEGEHSSIQEVYDMACEINADEIVLPDVFFEGQETIRKSEEAINWLAKQKEHFNLMAVPQGRNIVEWRHSAKSLLGLMVQTIGVPKNLVHTGGDYGRIAGVGVLIDTMATTGWFADIHLLGCWKDPMELAYLDQLWSDDIRGADSGIAYMYAKEGWKLDAKKHPKPTRPIDFNDTEVDEKLLRRNITLWREYCGLPNMSL